MNNFSFEGFDPANTTPVPDIFFDRLLPHLNEAQLKVMLYIIRRTLGFKKTSDAISLKQFRYGITTKKGEQLDEGCGLKNMTTIVKAAHSLEQMGCIESEKSETSEGDAATTVYRIRFRGTTPNVVPTTQDVVPTLPNVVGVLRETEDGYSSKRSRGTARNVLTRNSIQETVLQESDGAASADTTARTSDVLENASREEEKDNTDGPATAGSSGHSRGDDDHHGDVPTHQHVQGAAGDQERVAHTQRTRNTPRAERAHRAGKTSGVKPDLFESASSEIQAVITEWRAIFNKPVPVTEKLVEHAKTLNAFQPAQGEIAACRLWMYQVDSKGWYKTHGMHLGDEARDFERFRSLAEVPESKPVPLSAPAAPRYRKLAMPPALAVAGGAR